MGRWTTELRHFIDIQLENQKKQQEKSRFFKRGFISKLGLSTKYHKLDDSVFWLCKNCGNCSQVSQTVNNIV